MVKSERLTKTGMVVLVLWMSTTGARSARAADRWDLATSDTRATIQVSENRIEVARLASLEAAHDWAGEGMVVPLMAKVWVGPQEYPTAWTFDRGDWNSQTGTLVLRFTNREPRLVLRSIWRARAGHGPIEHWLELENLAGRRITVSQQESLSLHSLHVGGSAEAWWVKRGASNASKEGGTYREPVGPALDLTLTNNCQDGSSPVPWMAIQVGDRYGLYVGWEFSGLGRIAAKSAKEHERVSVDVGLQPEFKTDVEAGETFLIPPAFVGCYAGDVDDGSYTLHRFVLEKLRPAVPADYPDPSLNYAIYLDAGGPRNARTADLLRVAAWPTIWDSRRSCRMRCGFPSAAIGGGIRRGFRMESGRSRSLFMARE